MSRRRAHTDTLRAHIDILASYGTSRWHSLCHIPDHIIARDKIAYLTIDYASNVCNVFDYKHRHVGTLNVPSQRDLVLDAPADRPWTPYSICVSEKNGTGAIDLQQDQLPVFTLF